MLRSFLCVMVLTVGCAPIKFHYGEPPTEAQKAYYIARYWADAQELLEDKTNGASIVVPHDIFTWHWVEGMILFDGQPAYGLFCSVGGDIFIWHIRPWTIRHEACHAILHHLGHEDWKEYCHEGEEWQ